MGVTLREPQASSGDTAESEGVVVGVCCTWCRLGLLWCVGDISEPHAVSVVRGLRITPGDKQTDSVAQHGARFGRTRK